MIIFYSKVDIIQGFSGEYYGIGGPNEIQALKRNTGRRGYRTKQALRRHVV